MGNKVSKVSQGGRVLSKQTTGKASAKTTRLKVDERNNFNASEPTGEAGVADRLKKLGQVQYKPKPENYKPASEDKFTLTLEARKRIEEDSIIELEKKGPRKLLPATTITAVLKSIKEGDSIERIIKAYNLDETVIPKLQYLSIPERPGDANGVINQLLENNGAARQPIRRRRKEDK